MRDCWDKIKDHEFHPGAGNRFLGSLEGVQICALDANGHKNTNALLILKIRDIIFFILGKLHNGPFLGIFRGGLDFFDSNLGVKKVLAPSKYPLKWPIM